MNTVTIWHNPKCSKSREAMSILEENSAHTNVVKYLLDTPSVLEIKNVLDMLGIRPRDMMRTKEDIYKELNLKDEPNDDVLITAMAENPKLIERPILIKNGRAIIGRPTDKIANFLKD